MHCTGVNDLANEGRWVSAVLAFVTGPQLFTLVYYCCCY